MEIWIVALVFGFLMGCTTDPDETRRALSNQGFTEIETQGLAAWTCGEHDKTGRKFRAKNHQGAVVSGVVCCGVMKGCTVRW